MRFGVALKRCEHASLWGMVAYVVIPDLRCTACTEFNRSEPCRSMIRHPFDDVVIFFYDVAIRMLEVKPYESAKT